MNHQICLTSKGKYEVEAMLRAEKGDSPTLLYGPLSMGHLYIPFVWGLNMLVVEDALIQRGDDLLCVRGFRFFPDHAIVYATLYADTLNEHGQYPTYEAELVIPLPDSQSTAWEELANAHINGPSPAPEGMLTPLFPMTGEARGGR